jgi:SSS family transporter
MLFVGLFMMPFYYGSRARSVPEYLKLRFDEKTRTLNAASFAVMTVFSSGISMYAMGKLFNLLLGWSFDVSVLVSAVIVLAYVLLGGLTSAIYNEVLQFFLIVFGFAPLVFVGLRSVGGWAGLTTRLAEVSTSRGFAPDAFTSLWRGMGSAATNPIGVDAFGLVAGLGFVLSFGYWCTDFLVVQRAMAADSMTGARRTPLVAALPKMVFPFLVILPGMIAIALGTAAAANGQGIIPAKLAANGAPVLDAAGRAVLDYDLATPMMLIKLFPEGMLGLGLTALLASFMSGMAGNVTAFNTVWTYDLYQAHFKKDASDEHLLWMGRVATVGGIALSVVGGLRGRRVQQHHGRAAARVRVRERAAVRHLRARHVLAPQHRPRRLRRAGLGDDRRRRAPRPHARRGLGPGREGRLLRPPPHLPERPRPDVLDGHRRLRHLPRGDGGREHAHPPAPRRRAARPRLLAHRPPDRRRPAAPPAPVDAGGGRHRAHGRPQPHLLLNGRERRHHVTRHPAPDRRPVRHPRPDPRRLRGGDGRQRGAVRALGGLNINLWWGAVMLVFGAGLLVASRRRGA